MLTLLPNRFMVNLIVAALVLLALNEASRYVTGVPYPGCFIAGVFIGLQPVLMPIATVFVGYLFLSWFLGGLLPVIQQLISAWWLYLPGALLVTLLGDVSPCFA